MLRVRHDDAAAFEELMVRYQDRLVGVLAHLVGQQDLAEDLAQDVFLRVYRSRKSYQPGAKFSTWLFTIANNVASNARRTLARRKETRLSTPPGQTGANPLDAVALAASGLMPTRQLDRAELREVVQEAIQTLGDRQRLAMLLSRFEHLSYAEISQVMGLSSKAVKSLLARARTNLRDALVPYLEQGEKVEACE
jgi:RNA polymerase sigma-70 factor (ECF subfamily)